LTEDWYAGIIARLHLNAFHVERLNELDAEDLLAAAIASIMGDSIVGTAIHILPSIYNHDCGRHPHKFLLRISSLHQ
jgi:SET and MYND domain-containing protein